MPYNLASSTGPRWTISDLRELPKGNLDIEKLAIGYAPPDGSNALRRAIGDQYGIDPEWIVVTTGASEALSILMCLAADAGGNVALPTPAFPAFAAMAKAWGLGVNEYALERSDGFRQSAHVVRKAVDTRTVLALVNTPHNPTGSVCDLVEIELLAQQLQACGVPLIVDEVYHPLYHGRGQRSAAGLENVIVIGDMSKAFSLAGLRVGWIVDADPVRRKKIIDARSYFSISGSPLGETIATHAMLNAEAVLARLISVASNNLDILGDVFEKVADVVSWVRPSGGTTAYPWFVGGYSSRAFCEELAEAGLLIVPGDCFGAPEHVRIGFGALSDRFDVAAEILAAALASLQ